MEARKLECQRWSKWSEGPLEPVWARRREAMDREGRTTALVNLYMTGINATRIRFELDVRTTRGLQRVGLTAEEAEPLQQSALRFLGEIAPHLAEIVHQYGHEIEHLQFGTPMNAAGSPGDIAQDAPGAMMPPGEED